MKTPQILHASIISVLALLGISSSMHADPTPSPANERLYYQSPYANDETMHAVCSGQIKHLSETNLHSKSKNGALASIFASIDAAKQQGTPVILIIHGKGNHSGGASVVKAITRDTLKHHPAVLGYCSALPKDGSTGAVYVLIDA